MKFKSSLRRLPAVAALVLLPVLASAGDFNHVEGGFIQRDNYGRNDAGFRVGGMFDVVPSVAVYGEYTDNDETNQLSAGGLFHAPINGELDWFAGGGLEYLDVGPFDDLGFGLRAGLRYTPTSIIELTPEVRYYDAGGGDGQTSVRLSGAYTIAPQFALVAAVQGGDDNRLEAGLRYRFGGR